MAQYSSRLRNVAHFVLIKCEHPFSTRYASACIIIDCVRKCALAHSSTVCHITPNFSCFLVVILFCNVWCNEILAGGNLA